MLQCCHRHTLIMGLRSLPWPLNALRLGHTCSNSHGLASSRPPAAKMIYDPTQLSAYSEKPDSRRGDEYGPLWPPMLSEPADGDVDAGLFLPLCPQLLPQGPVGLSRAQQLCLHNACGRPSYIGRSQHGICLQIRTLSCRLRDLSSPSGVLCSQAAGDWRASQPEMLPKRHRAFHTWTGAETLTLA